MQAVRDIMTTDVITLDPGMTLREAATVLADHRVTGAPVVAEGHILGVLSASDILRVEADATIEDDAEWIDAAELEEDEDALPAPFFARLWPDAAVDVYARFGAGSAHDRPLGRTRLDRRTVLDEMTSAVLSIAPDATIAQAAERMAVKGVHRLLVVEEGDLAGIVTTTDIAAGLMIEWGAVQPKSAA